MRIFSDAVEAVKEVERDLWEMGVIVKTTSVQDQTSPEGFTSKEIQGYNFCLLDGSKWFDTFKALGYEDETDCIIFVEEEIRDRFIRGSVNPGRSWLARSELWRPFLSIKEPKKFAYTYSHRINEHFANTNQVVINERLHEKDPGSRQLLLQIYDQHTDSGRRGGIARVPCTMYYQFLDRGDTLTLIHNMRSCDLYKHFPIDLSVAWKTCERQAKLWNKKPRLIMQIGSLHAFEPDMKKRGIF